MKNYEIRVIPKTDIDGNQYWTAFFPAIKECVGGGVTVEDAIKEAEENLEFYLDYLNDEKVVAPEEYKEIEYSGKIALRVSKSTHKKLIELSDMDGISLNSFINNAIEQYIGEKNFDIKLKEKIEQIKELSEENNTLQKTNMQANTAIIYKLWSDNPTKMCYLGGNDEQY